MWQGTHKKFGQSQCTLKRENDDTSHKFIVADVLFLCTDEIKCGWSSKGFLPWTTTLLSSVLSLFLTVIYVIKCSFWAKLKGILLCFLFYLSWNTNLFVFLFQPKKVNFFLKKNLATHGNSHCYWMSCTVELV